MEQDKKEPDRNISLLKHERIEKIEVSVGDEIYSGEWTADSDAFSVSSDSGKIMQVSVCEDTEPDREEITYERYPHLYGPRGILKKEGKRFVFRDRPEGDRFEKLEDVLFGRTMDMSRRLLFALSLAAAGAELEEVFSAVPVKQLRLDAILVEKDTCKVKILSEMLSEECTVEDREREYRKLGRLGLMPPEWYGDSSVNPADLNGFRHFLAVLIFRALCASDPFDGSGTLRKFPYKGEDALKNMYGRNARYILSPSGNNAANAYNGRNASMVFSRICPRRRKLFQQTFTEGMLHPDCRPSAAQWLENQKEMVNWYDCSGQDWRIVDLDSGEGARKEIRYLCLDNGVSLPVVPDKCVCRYMLENPELPCDETVIGVFRMGHYGMELKWKGEEAPTILQDAGTGPVRLKEMDAQIRQCPWQDSPAEQKVNSHEG